MTRGGSSTQFIRFSSMALALSAVLLSAGLALATQNLVYLTSNISAAGKNSVIALLNDGTGHLSPLPGSPFFTGGTGVVNSGSGDQLDSDQEIIINPEATLLFAVNGDSNTIAVFRLQRDGSLATVPGSPFASGGQQPASLAFADNVFGQGASRLVVVNENSDPLQSGGMPNYTTFSVSSQGALTLGSSLNLPAGTSPTQAIVRPGKAQFFGIEFLNKTVSTYNFSAMGMMRRVSTVTLAGTSPVVVGAARNPVADALYVGLAAQNQLGVITFNAHGTLTPAAEVETEGMTPCWVITNAAGTVLYDAETPGGTISVWNISNSQQPVLLQHLAVGVNPAHMKIDPTGQFLYVLDRVGLLHVLNINSDGTVEENIAPYNLNLPAGTVPLGLAVLQK